MSTTFTHEDIRNLMILFHSQMHCRISGFILSIHINPCRNQCSNFKYITISHCFMEFGISLLCRFLKRSITSNQHPKHFSITIWNIVIQRNLLSINRYGIYIYTSINQYTNHLRIPRLNSRNNRWFTCCIQPLYIIPLLN